MRKAVPLATAVSAAVLFVLVTAVVVVGSFFEASKSPLGAPVAVSVPADAVELEPVAEIEGLQNRPNCSLPGQVCPPCKPCPYRHYPATCQYRHYPAASTAPFTVVCYHCRTPILVQPPTGQTGQTGDVGAEPETPQ